MPAKQSKRNGRRTQSKFLSYCLLKSKSRNGMEWAQYTQSTGCVRPARPEPSWTHAFGRGPARHRIKTGHAVSCRPTGPETKLEHGPVAIKRVVLGRPEVQINFHIFIFLINFVFLIKNLFNIIKFELKIYDSTLNNVIKIVYIIFCCAVSG
jgi:hypothetical protein